MTRLGLCIFVLLFQVLFSSGCVNTTLIKARIPDQIPEPSDIDAPFLFGKTGNIYIFATAGSNVLDVYRTKGPLLDYLGRKLNIRFRISFYRKYDDIVKAMINGDCDLAWLGPVTYLKARKGVACRPLAQVMIDGTNFYRSVILIRKGSGYSQIADLQGKSIAFTNRNSTSGYIYPWNFLNDQNINLDTFFAQKDFAGTHSNAIVQLMSGKYDAVAVEENALFRLKGKADIDSVAVLAEAGNIPNGPIAAHPLVPKEVADAIERTLIGMSSEPDGIKLLEELSPSVDFSGFGKISHEVYDRVQKKIEAVQ